MPSINEISQKQISQLDQNDLTALLKLLLNLESITFKLQGSDISVPLNISVSDGGEDGSISWDSGPEKTVNLPNRWTFFQNKATRQPPKSFTEEVLEKKKKGQPRILKSRVKEVVDANGCYVLFTTHPLNKQHIAERIKALRAGLREAGSTNAETFHFEIYDANKIADWVNQYSTAVILVQKMNGMDRPNGFQSWDDWALNVAINESKYHVDDVLENYKKQIVDAAWKLLPLRVSGHSGLGKTRLLFEAFRESVLRKSILYYDLAGDADVKGIKDFLLNHQNSQSGIAVIDNCSSENHNILASLRTIAPKLLLITIGFDDEKEVRNGKIILDRKYQYEIVKQIIDDELVGYLETDKKYLNRLCEGYPAMAIIFCRNIKSTGISSFDSMVPREFVKKLLFGSEEGNIDYNVIQACSVFSSFGFPDEEFRSILSNQEKELLDSQIKYICDKVLDNEVTVNKFYAICNKFKSKGIIERQGLYYVVKPPALAITLATGWMLATRNEKILEILTDLKGEDLGNRITERLKMLDQIDKAPEIARELWGPDNFFSSAEVLNTGWGSQLFRNIVELNPEATSAAIFQTFSSWTTEQLLTVREGRRNLVWALEKLVFGKDTFSISARLLYQFGAAENETWANNATNQFVHLFNIFLAGTEVSFVERVPILKWGLDKKDKRFTTIAIKAIATGFRFDHFTRTGGAEKQGSRASLKDYEPKSYSEIYTYWKHLSSMLYPYLFLKSEEGQLARQALVGGIRFFVKHHQLELIENVLSQVSGSLGSIWDEAITELNKSLQYENPTDEEREKIQSIQSSLKPTDIKSLIELKVSKAIWKLGDFDELDEYIDHPKNEAEKLAEFVTAQNIEPENYLPLIVQGAQMQAFNFGKKLGELMNDKKLFLSKALLALKAVPDSNQNPDLIGGFLEGSQDEELFAYVIEFLQNTPGLSVHAFYIVRIFKVTSANLRMLMALTDRYSLQVELFLNFQYGRMLENLETEDLLLLSNFLQGKGVRGKWVALSLLFSVQYRNEIAFQKLKSHLRALLSESNFLTLGETQHVMESFHWHQVTERLLKDTHDVELAEMISRQIIEYCSNQEERYVHDSSVSKTVTILFELYFENVWPIFGNSIIGNYWESSHLRHLLWPIGFNNHTKSSWIFDDEARSRFALKWMRSQQWDSLKRMASFMPVEGVSHTDSKWHHFSKAAIDEFGNAPGFLDQLSANMGTFGTAGSRRPYFLTQKLLLEELLNHSKLEVQDWARKMLEYTNREIKRTDLEDESFYLGDS